MKGIEPPTPSLPWKCSTPELHWLVRSSDPYQVNKDFSPDSYAFNLSGRRDSNPRPSAWKADALPTELLPHALSLKSEPQTVNVGAIGIEPIQTESPDLQSGPALQLRRAPAEIILSNVIHLVAFPSQWRDSNPRPADYKSAALAN